MPRPSGRIWNHSVAIKRSGTPTYHDAAAQRENQRALRENRLNNDLAQLTDERIAGLMEQDKKMRDDAIRRHEKGLITYDADSNTYSRDMVRMYARILEQMRSHRTYAAYYYAHTGEDYPGINVLRILEQNGDLPEAA